MGIPKFYRWISERYPCLSEKIREYQIPEFDNLYLDMNGIIHNCSHPNDEDIHLRIPEKVIYSDIFEYIDFLLKMIKPRKTFFMAVDGVAPRAKMNQQRGRRFRSAKMAEDQEAEAVRKGEVLPNEERFDSNCITPGTEFMARLHVQLQFFIKVKVSTDPLWQRKGLTIILSGHDVPGEGEHKIMDYIRHIRSQPNYDPDTRHCLYGLDADLMMLGLSTHELRFSLLREEVKFTKPRKSNKKSEGKRKPAQTTYDPTRVVVKEVHIPSSSSSVTGGPPSSNGCLSYSAALRKPPPPPPVPDIEPKDVTLISREEEGARGSYRAPLPEKTTFLLLHLSLLRDYIDEEFQGLRTSLEDHATLTYDLENVIDDWILLSILVGNDFVPHLPMLHIVKGAFPMLYQTYAKLLPSLGGYLNENGRLHLGRLEIFLQTLSGFDLEVFRETYDDMKYMESKTGRKIVLGEKMFDPTPVVGNGSPDEDEDENEITSSELKALIARTEAELQVDSCSATASEFYVPQSFFDVEDSEDFQLEFLQYKRNYYMEKMGMDPVTKESIRGMAEEYIRAIQWVLLYYYKGVSSWGWFYPHHYAPFCSDIHHLDTFSMEFVKGQPFKPFEQLLGVLPSQSGKLLPKCFYDLMIDTESPILDFYPKDFENDLNGKRNDWEAVVLIPFIDEGRLLSAMEQKMQLSPEEIQRNSRGLMHCYSYKNEAGGEVRSLNDMFPPLPISHFAEVLVEEVSYNKDLLPSGLHPKATRDKIYQGFPTLKSIQHISGLEKEEIKVFDFIAREESMLLSLIPVAHPPLPELAKKLLGKTVWVNWPHLTFALVTGVSDDKERLVLLPGAPNAPIVKDKTYDGKAHASFADRLSERHLMYKGIRIGDVDVLIWAKTMEGRRIHPGNRGELLVETQWSRSQQPFTLATTIHSEDVKETFTLDRAALPRTFIDIFAEGDLVIFVGGEHFGRMGTVESVDKKGNLVMVEIDVSRGGLEENLGSTLGHGFLKSRDYYTSAEIASRLQMPGYAIAKLTGTVFLSPPIGKGSPTKGKGRKKKGALASSPDEEKGWKENIGLNLKFNKRNLEVRGYSRKSENQWVYSLKAVELLQEYARKFPEVIDFLRGCSSGESRDSYGAEEIFPVDTQKKMDRLLEWIEEKGLRHLPRVPTDSKVLDDEDVLTVWKHVLQEKGTVNGKGDKKIVAAKPHHLHKPGLNRGCVGAGEKFVEFEVLDRVVCVDPSGPLPLGQMGTVIGLQNPVDQEQQEEEAFRSTSATVLKTIIVLPDPSPGSGGEKEKKKEDELRSALISILKINATKEPQLLSGAPKLLSFYPFQLLNVSQHQKKLRGDNQGVNQIILEARFGMVNLSGGQHHRYPNPVHLSELQQLGNHRYMNHVENRYYPPAPVRNTNAFDSRSPRNGTYPGQPSQQRPYGQVPPPRMYFNVQPAQIIRPPRPPPQQPMQQHPNNRLPIQPMQLPTNRPPQPHPIMQILQRPAAQPPFPPPYKPQPAPPPPPSQAKKIQAPIPSIVLMQMIQDSVREGIVAKDSPIPPTPPTFQQIQMEIHAVTVKEVPVEPIKSRPQPQKEPIRSRPQPGKEPMGARPLPVKEPIGARPQPGKEGGVKSPQVSQSVPPVTNKPATIISGQQNETKIEPENGLNGTDKKQKTPRRMAANFGGGPPPPRPLRQ